MTIKSDLNFVAQCGPSLPLMPTAAIGSLRKADLPNAMSPYLQTKTILIPCVPPAREGYTFLGWYDSKENSSGKPIDFKTQTFDRAETVYAHWAKNATVTFKIVNGYWSGNTTEDKTVTVVLHPRQMVLQAAHWVQAMFPPL